MSFAIYRDYSEEYRLHGRIFDGEQGNLNLREVLAGGYIVVDSIADWATEPPHNWSANWLAAAEGQMNTTPKVFQAGRSRCHIARYENEPFEEIMARIEAFLDKLALLPSERMSVLYLYIERPTLWAESTLAFAQAMTTISTTQCLSSTRTASPLCTIEMVSLHLS
ncbi:hypothetical protein C8F01DRAFT_1292845 [Mycena amicta]|nr:hypothetical protein C8F01DRAFT_1292845 [Mycena amicta]